MEALKRPNWDFSEKRDEKLLWLDKNECNYKSVKSFIREIYKSIDINSLSTYNLFTAIDKACFVIITIIL